MLGFNGFSMITACNHMHIALILHDNSIVTTTDTNKLEQLILPQLFPIIFNHSLTPPETLRKITLSYTVSYTEIGCHLRQLFLKWR